MLTEEEIKKRVYDHNILLEDLRSGPGTYKTILGSLCTSGTCNFILRRKLNGLYRDGFVYKTTIPGTSFGECLFYMEDKTYYILMEKKEKKVPFKNPNKVYYFYKFLESKEHIHAVEGFVLNGGEWKKTKDIKVHKDDIIKWI